MDKNGDLGCSQCQPKIDGLFKQLLSGEFEAINLKWQESEKYDDSE